MRIQAGKILDKRMIDTKKHELEDISFVSFFENIFERLLLNILLYICSHITLIQWTTLTFLTPFLMTFHSIGEDVLI